MAPTPIQNESKPIGPARRMFNAIARGMRWAWKLWDGTVGKVSAILGKTAAILGLVAVIVKGILMLFPPAPNCFAVDITLEHLRQCVQEKEEIVDDPRFKEIHLGRSVEWTGELLFPPSKLRAAADTSKNVTIHVARWTTSNNPTMVGVGGLVSCSESFPTVEAAASYVKRWNQRTEGARLRFSGVITRLNADALDLANCLAVAR
ncbi:hypothetical protein QTH90_21610 [Variovorax sp. J2P1-59]|uniref:hypothetical protein n=1 Tax=Variovorax flavidus TaxID=3053501 RepID=UPI0025758276|nr:hypothetical protein [Variovorax sp. J2P1-59]MDM0077022.1 hypothetical protein [Variovorax sp. J2P1-59]